MVAGPSFSWNIFQYGRVKNNIRFEDARFQETITNYNKKVLQAVNEVTNALEAYDLYLEQKSLRLQSVNSSIRAFNISMTQYENGQISFERLLNSVEKMTRAEDSYATIKGNVANQVVALYKALGGGGKPKLVSLSYQKPLQNRCKTAAIGMICTKKNAFCRHFFLSNHQTKRKRAVLRKQVMSKTAPRKMGRSSNATRTLLG
ncbi:LOW QUALITY PROTEIN: putative outer membrane protein [Vibrio sp. JCM 19052]|nr:LOW QUALITY PROTEIN: putative outer membrane protein [Vibrio sp. JCM 19052]